MFIYIRVISTVTVSSVTNTLRTKTFFFIYYPFILFNKVFVNFELYVIFDICLMRNFLPAGGDKDGVFCFRSTA